MKKTIYIIIALLIPCVCFGATENFYVCQGGDGTLPETATCATAWDLADVNTAGNWESGVDADDGKIGANDNVNFMDDGGSLIGYFTVRGSGSSGKPITFQSASGDYATIDVNMTNLFGIYIQDKSYLAFKNFRIQNATRNTLQAVAYSATITNLLFDGMYFHDYLANHTSAADGVYLQNTNNPAAYDFTDVTFTDCEFYGAGNGDDTWTNDDALKIINVDGLVVENCVFSMASSCGLDVSGGTNNVIRYNYFHKNGQAGDGQQVKLLAASDPTIGCNFSFNKLIDGSITVNDYQDGVIANNIFYSPPGLYSAMSIDTTLNGISFTTGTSILNNIFVTDYAGGTVRVYHGTRADFETDVTFENNLHWQSGAETPIIYFNEDTGNNVTEANFSTWASSHNDVYSEPMLNTNYLPRPGSPCINAGQVQFSDGDGNQYDFRGSLIWDDSTDSAVGYWADGVDLGAFGYAPPSYMGRP